MNRYVGVFYKKSEVVDSESKLPRMAQRYYYGVEAESRDEALKMLEDLNFVHYHLVDVIVNSASILC